MSTIFEEPLDIESDRTFFSYANNIRTRYNAPKIAFVDSVPKVQHDEKQKTVNLLETVIRTAASTPHLYTTKMQAEYFIQIYNQHIEELTAFHEDAYLRCIKEQFFQPLMQRIENMCLINRHYVDPKEFATYSSVVDKPYDERLQSLQKLVNEDETYVESVSLLDETTFTAATNGKHYAKKSSIDNLFIPVGGVVETSIRWLNTPLAAIGQTWRLIYVNCVVPLKILYESMEKISMDLTYIKTILGNKLLFNTKVHYLAMESSRILLGRLHRYIVDFYQLCMQIHEEMRTPAPDETKFLNIFSKRFLEKPFLIDTKDEATNVFIRRLFGMLICLSGSVPETKDILNPTIEQTLHRYYFPTHYDQKGSYLGSSTLKWLFGFGNNHSKQAQDAQSERTKLCFTLFEYMFQFEEFLNTLSTKVFVQDIQNGILDAREVFMNQFVLGSSSSATNFSPLFGQEMYEASYKKQQSHILHNKQYLDLVEMRDKALKRSDTAAAIIMLPSQNKEQAVTAIEEMLKKNQGLSVEQYKGPLITASTLGQSVIQPTVIEVPYNDPLAHPLDISTLDKRWIQKYRPYRVAYTSIQTRHDGLDDEYVENTQENREYAISNLISDPTMMTKNRNTKANEGHFLKGDQLVSDLHVWLFGHAPTNQTPQDGSKNTLYRIYSEMVRADGQRKFVTRRLKETDALIGFVLSWKIPSTNTPLLSRLDGVKEYSVTEALASVYYNGKAGQKPPGYWRMLLSNVYSMCSAVTQNGKEIDATAANTSMAKIAAYTTAILFVPRYVIPQIAMSIGIKARELLFKYTNRRIAVFIADTFSFLFFSPFRYRMMVILGWTVIFAVGWFFPPLAIAMPIALEQILANTARTVVGHYLSIIFTARVTRFLMGHIFRAQRYGTLKMAGMVDAIIEKVLAMAYPGNSDEVKRKKQRFAAVFTPIATFLSEYFMTLTDLVVTAKVYEWVAWVLDSSMDCITPKLPTLPENKPSNEGEIVESIPKPPEIQAVQDNFNVPLRDIQNAATDYVSNIISPYVEFTKMMSTMNRTLKSIINAPPSDGRQTEVMNTDSGLGTCNITDLTSASEIARGTVETRLQNVTKPNAQTTPGNLANDLYVLHGPPNKSCMNLSNNTLDTPVGDFTDPLMQNISIPITTPVANISRTTGPSVSTPTANVQPNITPEPNFSKWDPLTPVYTAKPGTNFEKFETMTCDATLAPSINLEGNKAFLNLMQDVKDTTGDALVADYFTAFCTDAKTAPIISRVLELSGKSEAARSEFLDKVASRNVPLQDMRSITTSIKRFVTMNGRDAEFFIDPITSQKYANESENDLGYGRANDNTTSAVIFSQVLKSGPLPQNTTDLEKLQEPSAHNKIIPPSTIYRSGQTEGEFISKANARNKHYAEQTSNVKTGKSEEAFINSSTGESMGLLNKIFGVDLHKTRWRTPKEAKKENLTAEEEVRIESEQEKMGGLLYDAIKDPALNSIILDKIVDIKGKTSPAKNQEEKYLKSKIFNLLLSVNNEGMSKDEFMKRTPKSSADVQSTIYALQKLRDFFATQEPPKSAPPKEPASQASGVPVEKPSGLHIHTAHEKTGRIREGEDELDLNVKKEAIFRQNQFTDNLDYNRKADLKVIKTRREADKDGSATSEEARRRFFEGMHATPTNQRLEASSSVWDYATVGGVGLTLLLAAVGTKVGWDVYSNRNAMDSLSFTGENTRLGLIAVNEQLIALQTGVASAAPATSELTRLMLEGAQATGQNYAYSQIR
jgi:hypothetical protein